MPAHVDIRFSILVQLDRPVVPVTRAAGTLLGAQCKPEVATTDVMVSRAQVRTFNITVWHTKVKTSHRRKKKKEKNIVKIKNGLLGSDNSIV